MEETPSADRLRIAILAAGAAGMYCGSCIRDNALAMALKRLGHDCVMIPLYTPVKTDADSASIGRVFYGGVNTWLQHASRLFRKTPRALDWLMDRPWLLTLAGNYGAQTSPARLGDFTLDILRGETGNTTKELRRLIAFLRSNIKPQVISLPNLMFIGAARMLKAELNAPVVAELTGEDIFLNAMSEPYKTQARDLIRQRAGDVDRFVATSRYYADEMAHYLAVPREKIDVVYSGIPADYLVSESAIRNRQSAISTPPTVGYLARICPEKGIDQLVDALLLLRKRPGFERARLRAAGYLGKANAHWYRELASRVHGSNLDGDYRYLGEVNRSGKLSLIDSADVLAVPTRYAESKGMYVLESLARGTPVVLPHHGAFPELIEQTHGGVTHKPGDPQALADALAQLLSDPARRAEMARTGHAAVRERFLDTHMAQGMLDVYRAAMTALPAAAGKS
ncbi:MAG TPA: glycosyltransferase family 4 protein [Tepidisphaeraceae bacterium]|jgi:glycosyltransferase involved in cell wall biosynthesis